MGKKILAIGGAVIKTAQEELVQVIEQGHVEMLIHNGGSIFHDFQIAIDPQLKSGGECHSHRLDSLIKDPSVNAEASEYVWEWLACGCRAPEGSATRACEDNDIDVLMFTVIGGDFWHLFRGGYAWSQLGALTHVNFGILRDRFMKPFHYVCMGSAVVHPEVFTKAIAGIKLPKFQADVVDFKHMYRPSTRVAPYGNYYCINHLEYLQYLRKNLV